MKSSHRRLRPARLALSAIALFFSAPSPLPAAGRKVIIVKSSGLAPFEQAAREFKKCLGDKGVSASIEELVLPDNPAAAESALRTAAAGKPDLLLTVGFNATNLVREKVRGVSSIFCMVLDPTSESLSKGGVSMDPRPQDYADYLKRNFPQFKRIGILYNPLKTKTLAGRYREAEISPSSFVFEEARGIGEIEGAIGRLKSKADCLLMITDPSIYTPQTVPQILLQTIQTNLPFIALSAPFVKSGALAALYADWGDNGCQAADLAARALHGDNPASLPLLSPRKLGSAVNLVVAGRLGVSVSNEARASADEVVR